MDVKGRRAKEASSGRLSIKVLTAMKISFMKATKLQSCEAVLVIRQWHWVPRRQQMPQQSSKEMGRRITRKQRSMLCLWTDEKQSKQVR